jgi:hypothetical protein
VNWIISIIGTIFLVVRIWLCEYKIKKELDFRARFFSRILNYYYAVAMILSFENNTFNLIFTLSLPFMVYAFFGWDVKYFLEVFKNKEKPEKFGWIFLERITLHLPLLIHSLIWWILGVKNFFLDLTFLDAIIALILCYLGFMLFDVRWTKKHHPPAGKLFIISGTLYAIGWFFYLFYF